MGIGILSASGLVSSFKKGVGTPTNRFATTSNADQLVLLTDKTGKNVRCNSVTIEANATPLYISILRPTTDPSGYDFSGEDVVYVTEETSITISGVEISGIKIWGASGQSYYIVGTRF